MSTDTSLCGDFTVFSKFIICAMMFRGRHRGLPYALDRAIKLPTEDFGRLEPTEQTKMRNKTTDLLPRFKTI